MPDLIGPRPRAVFREARACVWAVARDEEGALSDSLTTVERTSLRGGSNFPRYFRKKMGNMLFGVRNKPDCLLADDEKTLRKLCSDK